MLMTGFTIEQFEIYLLILIRVSSFLFIAPFFGFKNTPIKVKVGFSIFLSFLLFQTIKLESLTYIGTIGYAILVGKEFLVGLLIAFFCNICMMILSFAGHIIDMEIGLSMVNLLDPATKIQTTITGNLYSYFVMLMLLITNLHHVILKALAQTYQLIPIGEGVFPSNLYVLMVKFLTDYFWIGFRIVFPMFASILLVNIILAILAKVAPQMNMFVVGMQLKILCGLMILLLMMALLPSVSDFIFNEMKKMMNQMISFLQP